MTTFGRRSTTLVLAISSAFACVPGGRELELEDEALGRVCSAVLTLTGSFEAGAPQPDDVFGCWPVGTWTFTGEVEDNECNDPPRLEPEYKFLVERDADSVETYTYLTDPSYERVRIKVTSGGGGLCEAGLELFSPDGTKVLNLKPALQADLTINGFGEYDVYRTDQW